MLLVFDGLPRKQPLRLQETDNNDAIVSLVSLRERLDVDQWPDAGTIGDAIIIGQSLLSEEKSTAA